MKVGPHDPTRRAWGEDPKRDEDAEEAKDMHDQDGALDQIESRRQPRVEDDGKEAAHGMAHVSAHILLGYDRVGWRPACATQIRLQADLASVKGDTSLLSHKQSKSS